MRTMDKDYVTIVQQACNKVTGFEQLYKEMERAISITGKSKSGTDADSDKMPKLTTSSQPIAKPHVCVQRSCLCDESRSLDGRS